MVRVPFAAFKSATREALKRLKSFKLGEVSVSLDIGPLSSDTVRIHEIVISAPEVTCECKSDGSNLETLKRNV